MILNPFLANVHILYPLFSGGIKWEQTNKQINKIHGENTS